MSWSNSLKFTMYSALNSNLLFLVKLRDSLNSIEFSSLTIYIYPKDIKYFLLFLRMSTMFFTPQSLDLFSFQSSLLVSNIAMYLFYLTQTQLNLKIFILNLKKTYLNYKKFILSSVDTIFQNYWWLEREVAEMTDFLFYDKIDSRNLLLEYFNVIKPLSRAFPSVGLFEFFYSLVFGFFIHYTTSLQF